MQYLSLTVLIGLLGACGAQQLRVEPVTVEPIHITIDISVHDQPSVPTKPADPLGR